MPSMNFPLSSPSGESGIPFPRRPWPRRIPWDTLAVVVASGAFLAFFYRIPPSSTDEGMIAAGAERILRGQVPYRDFFSELGPGSFYLQAVIFHFGGISVSAFRLTAWILGALLSGLIYFLGKKIIRGPAAWVPPFIFATTCYPFVYYVNHHWWGNFFFLLDLVCLAASTLVPNEGGSLLRRILLLGAGLLAALTLLCMQPKGAWAVFIGVAFLILAEQLSKTPTWPSALRAGLGGTFWFLFGVGTAMALMAGYFWSQGAFGAWVYDNFTFLFTNYLPYETWPGVYSWTRFTHVLRWVTQDRSFQSISYLGGFYFYAVVGPAIGFGGAIWQVWRQRVTDHSRSRLLLLFLLAGLGSLISELHEPNVLHLIWASPLILILFVDAGNEAIRRKGRWRNPLVATAALTITLVIVVAALRTVHVGIRNTPVQTRRGTIFLDPETATIYQKWVDAIEHAVPAGDEAFFFPYDAQFYFLTATHNPTRYDVLIPGFHSAQQFEEAISSLQRQQPSYAFSFGQLPRLSPRAHYPDDSPDFLGPDPMERSLEVPQSHYRMAESVEGMEVWVLKK
jgi:hypothetical protein